MSERIALPAVRSLSFGEPLRVAVGQGGRYGALVSDTLPSDPRDRIAYGGSMVAESVTLPMRERIRDCVNFCGGMHFPGGTAYVGGARDMLEIIVGLFAYVEAPGARSRFRVDPHASAYWSAHELLRRHDLDPDAIRDAAEEERKIAHSRAKIGDDFDFPF